VIQNQGLGEDAEFTERVSWHLDLKQWLGFNVRSRRVWTLLFSLMVSYLFGIPIRHRTLGRIGSPQLVLY
jgi:hypothetical protein